MEATQREQQHHYKNGGQPQKLKLGDWVLLLLLITSCKFLAKWQGSHTIMVRVGCVNYHLKEPGKRALSQLYHIILFNPWIEPYMLSVLLSPSQDLKVSSSTSMRT